MYVTAGGDYWHGKHQAWLKCIDASRTRRDHARRRSMVVRLAASLPFHAVDLERACLHRRLRAIGSLPRREDRPGILVPSHQGRRLGLDARGRRQGLCRHATGRVLRLCCRQGETPAQHDRTRQSHEQFPGGRQWRPVCGHDATALCDRQALTDRNGWPPRWNTEHLPRLRVA